MFGNPKPRRSSLKRLSYPDSVRFLANVKRYLPAEPHGRTLKLSTILGCDRRTAQRLLNESAAGVPRLRKSYLVHASAFTGETMASLLNAMKAPTEVQDRMNLLMGGLEKLDHFKEMALLAATMAARCMFGYEMPASFSVESNAKREPTALRVHFQPPTKLGEIHEVAIVKDPTYQWCLVYNHPEFGQRFRGVLTDDNFEKILSFVKHNHKYDTQQSTRSPHARRVRKRAIVDVAGQPHPG